MKFLLHLWTLAAAPALAQTIPAPPVSPAPVTRLEYYAEGNFKRRVEGYGALNLSTQHEYDGLQRLRKTTDARGKATEFVYNGREDLIQVTDPRQLVTGYPRNGLGDATHLHSPDTGSSKHTFDAAGNLKTRLDNRGVLATYNYDAINRRTSIEYGPPGVVQQVINWNYDQTGSGFSYGKGRLTSTQFAGGMATYAYDPLGRLLTTAQTIQDASTVVHTVGYGYDAAGRITSITYPSGRVLSIPHAGGLPSGMNLTPPGGSVLALVSGLQFEPVPGGQGPARSWLWHLNSSTLANERVYDSSGRMVRHPLGGALRDITYDAADRISSLTHRNAVSGSSVTSLDQSFGYDELGRVTSVSTGIGSWIYAYDDNGNRTVSTHSTAGTSNYTIASQSNRLLSISNPSRTFGYDAAGNTESDRRGTVGWYATYDPAGQVAEMRTSSNGLNFKVTRYFYNAAGQRVFKETYAEEHCNANGMCSTVPLASPESTVFVYDQEGRLLGEYDGANGSVKREYVWLQDMPVAIIDGAAAAPAIAYVHTDHLGTPRTVIDRLGRQRWTWVAEPFGNSSPVTNPLGFGEFVLNLRMPGQYHDSETGLDQNWHRTYDASIGRYTQSDPIGLAGGINTYAYAESQPTSLTDPMGLATYMCRAPLHAVTGAFGEGRATWAMSNVPMAHHRYLCLPGQCGGQDQRGEKWSDPLWGPGKKSKDEFNAERCEQKEPDNTCIESCVRRRLDGPRPTYGIPLATDCQEWAEEVLNSCRYECSSSTPTDRPYIGYPSSGRRSKR